MRKNAPFSDIPDDKTKYWLLNDKVFTCPDQKLIDLYSESISNIFEPRESVKVTERFSLWLMKYDSASSEETRLWWGGWPRAIFYFYTFYKSAADKKVRHFLHQCYLTSVDGIDSTKWTLQN